jgi:hypothetical protein
MPKRVSIRESGGLEGRSERPAIGAWAPPTHGKRLDLDPHEPLLQPDSAASGSDVQGMRLDASNSPASHPPIIPAVAASARTRG